MGKHEVQYLNANLRSVQIAEAQILQFAEITLEMGLDLVIIVNMNPGIRRFA